MRFEVLGPLRVTDDGQDLTPLQAMPRRLLAFLICRANVPMSADTLIDVLWDDKLPATPQKTVQVYLHRLRKSLADAERITTGPGGYTLHIQPGERDIDVADRLVASARGAIDAVRAQLLREALTLWRDEPLHEFLDIAAVRAYSEHLAERRLAVLAERIDADLALGNHAEIIGELVELVGQNPGNERFRAQLVLTLYRSGRRADALAAYRDARRYLIDEVGVEPGAELRAQHEAVLHDDPALGLVSTVRPAQLPPRAPHFTTRDGELAELDRLLDDGSAVTVISGSAGVGKTSLAIQWAHRVRDRFPDGQLFVNLRGFATAEPLPATEALVTLLRALSVPGARIPTSPDEAAGLYRTLLADRRVLIVLDNAADADHVRLLLPGSPTCHVLVTSRNRLNGLIAVDGAQRVLLDVLAPAEAAAILAKAVGSARAEAEPAALADLAESCGYLPLALRIAAANLHDYPRRSIADTVAELRSARLPALSISDDEQANIRAVFDVSYLRLDEDLRELYRLLGAMPEIDTTPAAAAALADSNLSDVTRRLRGLADAHLLRAGEGNRYTFHDLIRAHAAEHADEDEPRERVDAALDRLIDWYLDHLHWMGRRLIPHRASVWSPRTGQMFRNAADGLAWGDAESDNIDALVRRAAATGRHAATVHLVALQFPYLVSRAAWTHGVRAAELAVAAATGSGDRMLQLQAYNSLVLPLTYTGRLEAALEAQQRTEALARELGDKQTEAVNSTSLAIILSARGQYEDALVACYAALELLDQADAGRGYLAVAEQNIGETLSVLGRHDDALAHHLRALKIGIDDGEDFQVGASLACIGETFARAGDHAGAIGYFERALPVLVSVGSAAVVAFIRGELGRSRAATGDALGAARARAEAAEDFVALDNTTAAIGHLLDSAQSCLDAGEPDAARAALTRAGAIRAGHLGSDTDSAQQRFRELSDRIGEPAPA